VPLPWGGGSAEGLASEGSKFRFGVLLSLCGLLFFSIFLRCLSLHLRPDPRIEEALKGQYWSRVALRSDRGFIFDRNGLVVASSVPSPSVYAVPGEVQLDPAGAQWFRSAFGEEALRAIDEARREGRKFVWIKRRVDQSLASAVLSADVRGLYVMEERKRFYPFGPVGAHVLGFCGLDDQGLEGLEFEWDSFLSSRVYLYKLLRDARGRIVGRALASPPDAGGLGGRGLQLTLDFRYQHFLDKELSEACSSNGAEWGAGILMSAVDGRILAMASYPSFDPNSWWDFPPEHRRNNAVSRVYEPGSTVKPLVAAIGLELGKLSGRESFYCPGYYEYAGTRIRCIHSHGRVSLEEVLMYSCNAGAIEARLRVEDRWVYEYLRAFGFGSRTGVELPGEEVGLLPPFREWFGATRALVGIGHGFAVTPVQLAAAYCALVNGGFLVRPRVVEGVLGEERFSPAPMERRQVISPEVSAELRRMLRRVVQVGTARKAAVEGLEVGGKTGTAQIAEEGRYTDRYVISFVGFWPAEEPRHLLLLVMGRPRGGIVLASEIVAPLFSRVVREVARFEGGLSSP